MQKVIIIPLIALTMSCAGSFHNTLGKVQDAAIAARMTFQPVIDSICKGFHEQCVAEKAVAFTADAQQQAACDAYQMCSDIREHIISVFEHIQMLIADANLSYSIGDAEGAEQALQKAMQLIEQIRDQLRGLGYLE